MADAWSSIGEAQTPHANQTEIERGGERQGKAGRTQRRQAEQRMGYDSTGAR